MATTAAPDGVVLEVVRAADSPSQERLVRIAAMLRDAELAVPVAPARNRLTRRTRRTLRVRRAA